jgi:crossover junction endodeoxyribonuclease RuvC
MIILGIDPGIADTGYGVIAKSKDKLKALDYGSIKTKPKIPTPNRLSDIRNQLKKIIKLHKPNVMAVEEIFFSKNTKTAISVAESRGVVISLGIESGCQIREFTPLEVKQALTGYGKADKKQIQIMVKTILNLKSIPKSDDASDALAVAICSSQTHEF